VDYKLVIGLIVAIIVVILVVVQLQIRRQYDLESPLPPDAAASNISRAIGGGVALFDAAGDLSIPFNGGILSVALEPVGTGSNLHVWLSQYNFISANGFQVLAYKGKVSKIRRAVSGS